MYNDYDVMSLFVHRFVIACTMFMGHFQKRLTVGCFLRSVCYFHDTGKCYHYFFFISIFKNRSRLLNLKNKLLYFIFIFSK